MPEPIGFQKQVSQEVVEKAQSGDMLAFAEIYDTYADACYNLALRICNNRTLAQDITQEVFITIINRISSFRGEGYFAGWVRRIVSNHTINRIKAEARVSFVDGNEIEQLPASHLFDHDWFSSCHDLQAVLKQLSTTSRAVLLLHEVEGYSHKEIAELFEKSESFSKVTLSRAYGSLKKFVLEQEQNSASK